MTTTLEWREQEPIPGLPLKIWTSLLPEEAAGLRWYARNIKVVEIGTAFGFSTIAMAHAARHVWTIDPHDIVPSAGLFGFKGDDLGKYKQGTLPVLQSNLELAGVARKVTIVQARSEEWLPFHLEELREVKLAFIDGNHSLDVAAQDLDNCVKVVDPGGTVALHDYDESSNPGVKQAVDAWLKRNDWLTFDVVGTLAIIGL